MIHQELNQIKSNMDTLMDSLKYISQQIITDTKINDHLRAVLNESTSDIDRFNSQQYIRERITLYEASNSNISNITFVTWDKSGILQKINHQSLLNPAIPTLDMRLTTQNQIVYYGPHTTFSRVSDYPVISVVRKIRSMTDPEVCLYLESGFRQLDSISSKTLDQMEAVYTIFSDNGTIVYSSRPELLHPYQELPASSEFTDSKKYRSYQIPGWSGWSICAFVPQRNYNQYLLTLSFGFVAFGLIAILLGLLAAGSIWRTIYRPLKLFDQNLQDIVSSDLKANIRTIHVQEFDQNFEYFEKMKQRIEHLIQVAQRQEQEKSRLEIKQLLSKMNPHFIHNTLDTLRWYAEKQGYQDEYAFLSAFNRLLMYNMEKNKLTTLQSELDAVNDYVLLQKMKYDIEYRTEVLLPAPMLQSEMPRFILQPLVENAIFHGLEGKGTIVLKVSLTPSGNICIRIINNGYPLNLEKINEVLHSARDLSSNGIGIQYVVQMLESSFPGAYQFHVFAENGETQVEIIIPFSKGEYYAKNPDC